MLEMLSSPEREGLRVLSPPALTATYDLTRRDAVLEGEEAAARGWAPTRFRSRQLISTKDARNGSWEVTGGVDRAGSREARSRDCSWGCDLR